MKQMVFVLLACLILGCQAPENSKTVDIHDQALLIAANKDEGQAIFPGLESHTPKTEVRKLEATGLKSGRFFSSGTPSTKYFVFGNSKLGNVPWQVSEAFFNDSLYSFSLLCFESMLSNSSSTVHSMNDLYQLMGEAYQITYGNPWKEEQNKKIWISEGNVIEVSSRKIGEFPAVEISHVCARQKKWINEHLTGLKFGPDALSDAYTEAYFPNRIMEHDTSLSIQ